MNSKKNKLLWVIENPENANLSYLFGTMHIGDLRALKNKDFLFQKIDACEAFALEYNLEESSNHPNTSFLFFPDGQNLEDFIPKKKYDKLRKILLKSFGFDIEQAKSMLPLFISNLIQKKIALSNYPWSIDEFLLNHAKEQNKVILGIETFAEQLEILSNISLKYQIKSLLHLGKNVHQARQSFHKMVDLYLKEDIQQLYQSSKKGSGEVRKILLFQRNEIMAKRIAALTAKQSVFIGIGAGHLGGGKGVLRLLKKKNLKVKKVSQG